MDLIDRVLHSRYRLDRKIGTGGSARVYQAWDLRLERKVAVKVLHPGLADDRRFLRRFEAEARSAAQLQHPGIVAVHDVGHDGLVFIVMELIDGGSLQDLLDADRTLTPAQGARLGAEVAAALGYAHRRGVIHRDIKPANILLSAEGMAKVADFGLARALAEAAWTEPMHTVLGTARYSPPEVLHGEPATPLSDLYSLGLVVAEVVTGQPVFAAETPVAVLAGRLHGAPTLSPSLGDLVEVIEKVTALDPADRYPDALAVQSAFAVRAGEAEVVEPAIVVTPPVVEPQPADRGPRTEEGPEPHAGAHRRRRWWWAVVPIVLLLGAAAAATPWALAKLRTYPVAAVVGLTHDQAEQMLRAQGWLVVDDAGRADLEVPSGIVLEQAPAGDASVRRPGTVHLVASLGLPQVEVPAVTGQQLGDAVRALDAAHLRTGTIESVFDTRPSLTVVEQTTGRLTAFAEVKLKVSAGLAPSVVPDVVGKPQADAEGAVKTAGLLVASTEEFSDDVEPGAVISQDIPPNTRIAGGRTVNLVISKGPDVVAIPDLRTQPVADAQAVLEGLGLHVTITPITGNKFVFETAPDHTQVARRGSTVIVYTI